VVQVAWSIALDDDMVGQSSDIQRVLDAADQTVDAAHMTMKTVLVQARNVGAAIVDEACAREADLIIVGLPHQSHFGEDSVGHVVAYVLRHAQCAVWVVREPIIDEV
jgi:nucleotide-binding universal stress UspA family protein